MSFNEAAASLARFPVCSWSDFPAARKGEFVAACIVVGADRSVGQISTPPWLIDLVVDGYDRGADIRRITKSILHDARFASLCTDLNKGRLPLLAEMIAREPIARLRSRLALTEALKDDDLLQIISTTPVCADLEEMPHLMNVRGRSASPDDLLPLPFCSNIVCRCEWKVIPSQPWYKEMKRRHRSRA